MNGYKHWCLWGVLAGVMALAPTQASAAPATARSSAPLATVTTKDSVEIRVQGVTPESEDVEWKWGKLVVSIDDTPVTSFAESYDDETVKRVALVGGAKPRLIVMFRHGEKTSEMLTRASTVENVGDGFRVTIPRKRALLAARKAAAASTEVDAKPEPEPEAVPQPEATSVAAAPTADEAPTAPSGTGETVKELDDEPLILPETNDESDVAVGATAQSPSSLYGTMGFTLVLLAIGGGFVWWKRRNDSEGGTPKGFTVMGNQVLGPKSRIVLMGLGHRRMLLAVSEAGTTVVDKWNEGNDADAVVRAEGEFDVGSLAAIEFGGPVEAPQPRTVSPRAQTVRAYQSTPSPEDSFDEDNGESAAVRGLLALRQQMDTDVDDPEEDDAWSRALAARMRAARSA